VWSDTATSYSVGNVIWFNLFNCTGCVMHQQV
jgi:Ni,Fe-hydrogenase I small subunit